MIRNQALTIIGRHLKVRSLLLSNAPNTRQFRTLVIECIERMLPPRYFIESSPGTQQDYDTYQKFP
jgi:hypothetical protein